ncbi:MAG: hypothetical protein RI990_7 [Planctomycetota bacterium]|jgi:hypothetical protein
MGSITFWGADAALWVDGRAVIRRELLSIDPVSQRFDVRAPGVGGSVTVDIALQVVHATLVGPARASLEIDFLVDGTGAAPVDAWAECPCDSSEAEIIDAFARPIIPDLAARDAGMAPLLLPPGRYVLRASTSDGPISLRVGFAARTAAHPGLGVRVG